MPRRAELESIKWPETMWPVRQDFLGNIPEQFLPDKDSLDGLQYPWELLALLRDTLRKRLVRSRIAKSAVILENVVVRDPVWIEEGVVVHPFSIVIGPVYLGKNTVVGNFTQLRDSLIGDGCLVGERTSVVRSVIGAGCSFHINYVGDSLLAEGVDMGGRAGTANHRLDGLSIKSSVSGVREDTQMEKLGAIIGKRTIFGGHSSTMPGIKVGENCMIYPNIELFRDVQDNTVCKLVQELEMRSISPVPKENE